MTSNINNTTYEVGNLFTFDDKSLADLGARILSQEGDRVKILFKDKVFLAAIRSFDPQTKQAKININGFDFQIKINEPIDQLINELGFLTASKHSVKEIKSPMPGLVVTVYVAQGQSVVEGDKLLSLEAMKMENILKSPGEGIVKSIFVEKGNTVDKNQILITFE